MANTIKIADSISYAQSYLGFRQLNIGANNEPALTAANVILQTVIGPPFVWNWNRATTNFVTTTGIQDYVQSLANFGFTEKASYSFLPATITNTALASGVITYTTSVAHNFAVGDFVTVTDTTNGVGLVFNITALPIKSVPTPTTFTVLLNNPNVGGAPDAGTANVGKSVEITSLQNILGTGTEPGPPALIAAQIDDNAGNITFRTLPISDRVYNINLTFQKRVPSLITNISQTWAPIPDHYSYIYQAGFLSLMMMYTNDPRWTSENQKFVANLLGAAEGLEEFQKNIFQALWLQTITQQQAQQLKTPQGVQARGT